MNLYSYVRAFWILLLSVCVFGDIIRQDNFFEGEFSNNHKGRMLRVLMAFNNLALDKCVVKCIQHLRCKTVNYNFEKEKCELTDVDFNDDEADKLSYDWYNIGTQPKVDGQWGAWQNASSCSATCGGGTMIQARDCDSPQPQHGGDDCVGKGERTIGCNTHPCPVNGNWSSWQNDTECNVTCGGGTMNQTRKCDSPEPKHGGKDCDGTGERIISCNNHVCPVDGQWGAWTSVSSACSVTCGGGTVNQTRKCDSPKPKHGGKDCDGDDKKTISCNPQACPVDGKWGAWTNDSTCSVTCGGGTMNQTRKCDSPRPEHGGKNCAGDDKGTISCNEQACPVNGGWGAWTVTSPCDAPCEGKTFIKTRKCDSPTPNHGGNGCSGHDRVSFPCYKKDCSVVNIALHKPATQSSTVNSATAATDGKSTYSMTKGTEVPWWQVDLQADVKIEYMIFRAYSEGLLNDLYNTNVAFSRKSSTESHFQLCKKFDALKNTRTYIHCGHTEKVRYIKITLKGKRRLLIEEFEVYAKPA